MNISVVGAVEQVINHRTQNGASKESLKGYIKHLLTETWSKCPNICEGIKSVAIKYDLI
jgi:hypothetical protein